MPQIPSQADPAAWSLETHPDLAFASPETIAAGTARLLAAHLRYCYAHSAFYRHRFEAAGLTPDDLQSPADLCRLPTTSKADLAEQGAAFLCVSPEAIVDLCQTSGTTGAPVALLQTEADLRRLAYNESQCFAAAGLTAADRVVVACALGRCFMAGLAYFEGLRRLGACAIRVGAGSPAFLGEALRTHRPTAAVGVPSVLLGAAAWLREQGTDPKGLGLRRLIGIGEPLRDPDGSASELGRRLTEAWGAAVRGTYASTEMATSFAECAEGDGGGHILPDLIVTEILDPEGRPVPEGTPGELVATPLQVTGMPLLRIRTGDIVTRITRPCPCGRRSDRIGPVQGRCDQMLKIRGTTVYPTAVFAALQAVPGVTNVALEVYDDFELSERADVLVSLAPDAGVTAKDLSARLQGRLRVKLPVTVVPAEALRRRTHREGSRKPVRLFDRRKGGLHVPS